MTISIPILDGLEERLKSIEKRIAIIEKYTSLFKPIEEVFRPKIKLKSSIKSVPDLIERELDRIEKERGDKDNPSVSGFRSHKKRRRIMLTKDQVRAIRETTVNDVEDIRELAAQYNSSDGAIRSIKEKRTRYGIEGHEDIVDGYCYTWDLPGKVIPEREKPVSNWTGSQARTFEEDMLKIDAEEENEDS